MSERPVTIGLAAALVAAVSLLPAGIGNVGKKDASLSGTALGAKQGQGLITTSVTVTLPSGTPITHNIVPGQTAAQVRNILVGRINAETTFQAYVVPDPADPNLAAFNVVSPSQPRALVSVQIDENEPNMDDIGVRQPSGVATAAFNHVSSPGNTVAGDGNYRLRIEMLMCPTYDVTFLTTSAPNNTAGGLDASIRQSLQSAGFVVTDAGNLFVISRPDDLITAVQVYATDTGITSHKVAGPSTPTFTPAVLPTLADYALFGLALALTAAGMLLLRRREGRPARP